MPWPHGEGGVGGLDAGGTMCLGRKTQQDLVLGLARPISGRATPGACVLRRADRSH